MDIQIYELIEGAKKARGLTVVIDVFRAFSLECYMFSGGMDATHPVGTIEEALRLKEEHPCWMLFGERRGTKIEGFEYGNAPSDIVGLDLHGRTAIHTTSSGTQGIINAKGADEIITGSLVNCDAVVSYIKEHRPEYVSLCAMGNSGVRRADEDLVCAEYIRAKLLGEPFDMENAHLRIRRAAAHFYDPSKPQFPEEDVPLCTGFGIFPFVIRVEKIGGLWTGLKIPVE